MDMATEKILFQHGLDSNQLMTIGRALCQNEVKGYSGGQLLTEIFKELADFNARTNPNNSQNEYLYFCRNSASSLPHNILCMSNLLPQEPDGPIQPIIFFKPAARS